MARPRVPNRMKKHPVILILAVAIAAATPAQQPPTDLKPEREISGPEITSKRGPVVEIEFDKAFRYIGGERFVLYRVADCELHLFVDADATGRIRRLYWVQFEGYLPSSRETYKYGSRERATIGGLEFILDSAPRSYAGYQPRAGSDGERVAALLQSGGYQLPKDALWLRMVHLTDASKRRELMIIYVEELAPLGLTVADLDEGGKAAQRWPEIGNGLLQRAQAGMKIAK